MLFLFRCKVKYTFLYFQKYSSKINILTFIRQKTAILPVFTIPLLALYHQQQHPTQTKSEFYTASCHYGNNPEILTIDF